MATQVERRVGLDSIPALKRRLIEHLATTSATPPTHAIAATLGYPPPTIFDALWDLAAYRVVQVIDRRNDREDCWTLTDWARQRLDAIGLDVTREPASRPSLDDPPDEVPDPLDQLDRDRHLGPYPNLQDE
jgi:hypothetical protein